jgi:hypothetical protein
MKSSRRTNLIHSEHTFGLEYDGSLVCDGVVVCSPSQG